MNLILYAGNTFTSFICIHFFCQEKFWNIEKNDYWYRKSKKYIPDCSYIEKWNSQKNFFKDHTWHRSTLRLMLFLTNSRKGLHCFKTTPIGGSLNHKNGKYLWRVSQINIVVQLKIDKANHSCVKFNESHHYTKIDIIW